MDDYIGKWRFKGNNFATENGLDTSDVETFKRDPISSLARETCQNSIDAKRDGEKKVLVEFNTFEVGKEDIPGYDRLLAEIINCKEYKRNSKKEYEQLSNMLNELSKDSINCIRISDFNTTGLKGDKFYLLTKGSGITDKVGTTGGSKGIGKYASFVASTFNTVFYSTHTEDGEKKSIGISKLCSAPIPGTEEKTLGIGFFGEDEKNSPILTEAKLDKNFNRTTPGTDLYILGFRNEKDWKQQIITKVLDSFLVAIYKDELEVKVDDILINSHSLEQIINNEQLISNNRKKSIYSQFLLIQNGEGVFAKEVEIENYGKIKIYVKSFSKEEANMATNNCIMIRYPYMQIKEKQGISSLPCSAMCIIENNELNTTLRDIENPQHTDWEPKRKDDELLIKAVKNLIAQIYKEINDFVIEVIKTSDDYELDVEGAGKFLPEGNFGDAIGQETEQEESLNDKPVIIKKSEITKRTKKSSIDSGDELGLIPDIGSITDEGNEIEKPEGSNNGKNGEPHNTEDGGGFSEEGDTDVLRRVSMTEVKKVFFVTSKEEGKYVLIINSNYNETDCELCLCYYDDADQEYKAEITSCFVNGEKAEISDGKAIHFKVFPGKTKFEMITNLRDYYRCEVKLYANR